MCRYVVNATRGVSDGKNVAMDTRIIREQQHGSINYQRVSKIRWTRCVEKAVDCPLNFPVFSILSVDQVD